MQTPINVIALAEVMKHEFKWWLNTVQNPSGLHIAFTLASAGQWHKFVSDMKACIALMKKKPELNHNSTVATYGMTAKVPDTAFLGNIANLHTAALLDTL